MTTRQTSGNTKRSGEGNDAPERKTIPAKNVGVTLTISDEARKELHRKQEDRIKGAQNEQKFAWR